MNTLKTTARNLIIFTILIIITFYVVFKNQNIYEFMAIINSAHKGYLLIGLFIMFLFFCFQAINMKILFSSLGEKIPFFKMLKFVFIEFFFSAITPASTGGQPVELYYMSKEKIPVHKATLVLLIQICSYQLGILFFNILGALIVPHIIKGIVLYFFIYGIIINIIVITFMYTCIFSKRISLKMIKLLMKISKIFHLKALLKKEDDIINSLQKYQEGSEFIKKHKKVFINSVLRAFIQISCHFVITYFVYKALYLNEYNIIQISAMQSVFFASAGCVPLPGSIGISELLFLTIYEPVFGEALLRPAMSLSLGTTFYFFVIFTLIIVIVNSILLKKRNK